MIGQKEIAQYALRVTRQIEELSPLERGEVMLIANQLVQIEVARFLRTQANAVQAYQAGFTAPPQDE